MIARNAIVASAVGASVLLGGMTLATPAQADSPTTRCHTSTKSFNLPYKPDVRVSATICARCTGTWGGYRHYSAWLHKARWSGTAWFIGGKRFNDFSVGMRLEHGSKSIDTCDSNGICEVRDLSADINSKESGSKTYSRGYGSVNIATKKTWWTGDATVTVDINGDGEGARSWGLHGTAAVR